MALTRWRPLRRNKQGVMLGTLRAGAGILWCQVGVVDTKTGGTGPWAIVLVGSGMLLTKISASCRKETGYLFPTLKNGVLGCGFCRALVSSPAVSMAASAGDMVGMV